MSSSRHNAAGRLKVKKRIRARVSGTAERPRLTVFKSAKHVYASLVDDSNAKTLMGVSSASNAFKEELKEKRGLEKATFIGKALAEKAKTAGIEAVVFDRNGFKYHGRIKAIADGAREGGLNF
jgi:large subunit ribosomal protein L18